MKDDRLVSLKHKNSALIFIRAMLKKEMATPNFPKVWVNEFEAVFAMLNNQSRLIELAIFGEEKRRQPKE